MSAYTQALEQLLGQGEALVQAQRFAEGEGCAREVLERQPRNARAHYILAASALMQGRHADALSRLEAAIRHDRVNPRYHHAAALCLSQLGRLEEAAASYRRALQYQPGLLEARANLGYLLERSGHSAEAAECYRKVLEAQPRDWYCLGRLGYCERVLGRPAEAVALLERAAAARPDFAATYNELALALMQVGRKEEAVAQFRRAVEVDPRFVQGWCNLGKILYLDHVVAAGAGGPADPAPVLACFERILALDPGNAEFAYLRDCVAGVRVARPPDAYIEAFFDRFAGQFDEKLVGELQYSAPQAAARFLAPWLEGRSGLRVVDLGCGTGLSGGFLRAAAASLVGVDLSGAMLERARERKLYDALVRQEIGEYLAERDPGSVDLLVALEVFNYVGDLERVMGLAARALAPGGRLLFTVELPPEGAGDFVLSPAGRYAHAPAYVESLARAAGLAPAASADIAIRQEAGRPVHARLIALDRKPGTDPI